MRRVARTDANQTEVVEALRAAGVSVLCLHQLGRGVPDLLVGTHRGNLLVELKDGSKPPSARKLTPDEARFFETWRGPRAVVASTAQAFEALEAHGLWRAPERAPVLSLSRDPRTSQGASGGAAQARGG